MAEQPPILHTKPTLLTIEAKWSEPIDQDLSSPIPTNYPPGCTIRCITSVRIQKRLKGLIDDPLAIYDNQNRLLSIIGKKDGKEHQFFDILSLHLPSRVDSKRIEEYTDFYVRLLAIRTSLRQKFAIRRETESVSDNDTISFDEKSRREEIRART